MIEGTQHLFRILIFLFYVLSSPWCIMPFLFYIIPKWRTTINKFIMTSIYQEPRKERISFLHNWRFALRLNDILWLTESKKNNPLRVAMHINYSVIQGEQKQTEKEEDTGPSLDSVEIKPSIAPCTIMASPNKNLKTNVRKWGLIEAIPLSFQAQRYM